MLDLAAVFVAGLLGSAHCVGMCGGFVALLGATSERAVARRQVAYFAGKTLTYTVFGAIAGLAGVALGGLFGEFGGVVSIGLGAVMILTGLAVCGVAWRRSSARVNPIAVRLGPLVGRLVASDRSSALVALGAVNGLLPCGLVYGMVAIAATSGGPGRGALTMAVFGLSTIPALALVGTLGARMRPSRRLTMQRLAGVLVIAMGVLTLARGADAVTPSEREPHAVMVCGTLD
ncbi:sulfite exporter TauE/SafE family protein [Rubrivirga sp.]|uniref:sulfite exporter TauE/SafE family protein n=1 Tax=Rubrivirga sp. TaxID=1885344 RepID=UPI003C77B7E0